MSWSKVSLDELCEIRGGAPAPQNDDAFENGTVPFVRMKDLGRYHLTNNLIEVDQRLSEKQFGSKKYELIPKGSILMPRSGSVALNHRAILGMDAVIVSHICALVIKSSRVDNKFLYYFLTTMDMRKYTKKTTGLDSINFSDIRRIQIPLPPIDEQRQIAEVLDKADALRQKRRLALQKLDTLLQSVFLEMFGDPAKNPKNWRRVTLGDVIFSAKDGPHVSPDYVDEGIPFLSTRNIRQGRIDWNDLKYISREDAQYHWRKAKPERGDILYTKGGTTGIAKAIDFDREIAVWVHVALLKTNHEIVEPIWLENMLNSDFCYVQSQRYTHGIANRDLGLKRMVKIEMYLPSLSEQRRFVDFTFRLEGLRAKLDSSLGSLESLFNSAQHRAFKGELFKSSMPSVGFEPENAIRANFQCIAIIKALCIV